MADFRKYAVTVAGLACMLGVTGVASAQSFNGFTCNATATPFDMRAEGITEQAGDLVLTCTGGTITPAGNLIPSVNITVSLNTNITSRLLNGSSNLTEALLLINEPTSGNQSFCPASTSTGINNCLEIGLGTGGASQSTFSGTGFGGVNQTYNPLFPVAGTSTTSGARYNGVQGTLVGPSQVTFFGVPVDPPGQPTPTFIGIASSIPTLTLRITNIRANASALGAATGFSVSTVFETTSTSAGFPINNNTQNVGSVRRGLIQTAIGNASNTVLPGSAPFSVNTNAAGSFQQCVSRALSSSSVPFAETINFSEGFATATKLRNPQAGLLPLSVPGAVLNTESQFVPNGVQGFDPVPNIGRADFATRIQISFNAIPTGVTLYVPTTVISNQSSEVLTLTGSASGSFSATSATSVTNLPPNYAAVTLTTGSGVAVYEVTTQNLQSPSTIETFSVPVIAIFTAAPASTPASPALGTSTVNVDFAPLSTVITAASGPIPRFVPSSTAQNGFSINPCSTVLLFPFLSNLAGFDTGLAIAATSIDPFGTLAQSGTCRLNFYGTAAPAQILTPNVTAGTVYTSLVSNLAPGFQGYMIAQCAFQYGHGFAFITDGFGGPGRGLSQGYLALIIPDPATNSGSRSPNNVDLAPGTSGEGLTN